jgi:hypothetical protein
VDVAAYYLRGAIGKCCAVLTHETWGRACLGFEEVPCIYIELHSPGQKQVFAFTLKPAGSLTAVRAVLSAVSKCCACCCCLLLCLLLLCAAGVGEDIVDWVSVMNAPSRKLEAALHGR